MFFLNEAIGVAFHMVLISDYYSQLVVHRKGNAEQSVTQCTHKKACEYGSRI